MKKYIVTLTEDEKMSLLREIKAREGRRFCLKGMRVEMYNPMRCAR